MHSTKQLIKMWNWLISYLKKQVIILKINLILCILYFVLIFTLGSFFFFNLKPYIEFQIKT